MTLSIEKTEGEGPSALGPDPSPADRLSFPPGKHASRLLAGAILLVAAAIVAIVDLQLNLDVDEEQREQLLRLIEQNQPPGASASVSVAERSEPSAERPREGSARPRERQEGPEGPETTAEPQRRLSVRLGDSPAGRFEVYRWCHASGGADHA